MRWLCWMVLLAPLLPNIALAQPAVGEDSSEEQCLQMLLATEASQRRAHYTIEGAADFDYQGITLLPSVDSDVAFFGSYRESQWLEYIDGSIDDAAEVWECVDGYLGLSGYENITFDSREQFEPPIPVIPIPLAEDQVWSYEGLFSSEYHGHPTLPYEVRIVLSSGALETLATPAGEFEAIPVRYTMYIVGNDHPVLEMESWYEASLETFQLIRRVWRNPMLEVEKVFTLDTLGGPEIIPFPWDVTDEPDEAEEPAGPGEHPVEGTGGAAEAQDQEDPGTGTGTGTNAEPGTSQ